MVLFVNYKKLTYTGSTNNQPIWHVEGEPCDPDTRSVQI